MASKYIDIKTVKFFMNNVQELDNILDKERFVDYNIESVDLYIESVKKFADRELFPFIKEMDEKPAHYKDGSIHVHQQVEKMMNCLLYTSPSPRDRSLSRMPSSA